MGKITSNDTQHSAEQIGIIRMQEEKISILGRKFDEKHLREVAVECSELRSLVLRMQRDKRKTDCEIQQLRYKINEKQHQLQLLERSKKEYEESVCDCERFLKTSHQNEIFSFDNKSTEIQLYESRIQSLTTKVLSDKKVLSDLFEKVQRTEQNLKRTRRLATTPLQLGTLQDCLNLLNRLIIKRSDTALVQRGIPVAQLLQTDELERLHCLNSKADTLYRDITTLLQSHTHSLSE